MKVTVVGGSGFIGNGVVRLFLSKGYDEVVNVDPKSPIGYVATKHLTRRVGPEAFEDISSSDVVVHSACCDIYDSEEKPVRCYKDNLLSLVKTVAMMHRDAKLVFLSSCSVYGDQGADIINEGAALRPFGMYSHAKVAAEEFLRLRRPENTTILRPSNVYGYGQVYPRHKGMVGKALYLKRRGEPAILYGNGEYIRDYTFVSDVVNAVWMASHEVPFGPYNVASGVGTSTLDLVKKIGVEYVLEPRHQDHNPRCRILSWERFRSVTGWKPLTSLDEGLRLVEGYEL